MTSTRRYAAVRRFSMLAQGAALAAVLTFGLAACKPQPTESTTGGKKPGSGMVIREREQADKLNAYVEAYNRLLQWDRFDEILQQYRKYNAKLRKDDRPIDRYDFSRHDLSGPIKDLNKALAIEAKIPELDAAAVVWKASLEAADPLFNEASVYATTKEYLSDKGVKARQMDGPLVAALIAADHATDAFGAALSVQTLKRDEAQLVELPPGTVSFQKLKVSLAVRKLSTAVQAALGDPKQTGSVAEALAPVTAANAELGALKVDPKAQPTPDPVCKAYKSEIDNLIGLSRTLVSVIEKGNEPDNIERAAKSWFETRNRAVDSANRCG